MLRVIPLGGLGEIGLNAMVFESRGEQLLIDCGLMFPTAEMPGVEIVIPDLSYVLANRSLLKGVVLTHAHEDHLGALPYLLAKLPVPVYGTRLTLAMLSHRLGELGIEADLREIEPRAPFSVGNAFTVEAIRVCHSVPDGVGLAIRTDEGTVVHTGDFKLDGAPIDGRPTDLERFGELGDEGVLCLLSDSTNAELEGQTGGERLVADTFARLFEKARRRVVVSMFASNLLRVQHTLELAERVGRFVALLGRSMIRNVEIASGLGYLRLPPGLLIPADDAPQVPPRKLVVLTTGAQAEPRSGLVGLVADPNREPHLERGDLVILSSRPIPGNERAVSDLIDQLFARGVEVAYFRNEPFVHVSGHASRDEQRRVLEAVRPKCFIPVHGELRMLHRHLELARECGVPDGGLLLARDGDVVGFEEGHPSTLGQVAHGRIFRDRFGGGGVVAETLKERAQLAETGIVVAVVALSNGRVVRGPELYGRALSEDEAAVLPEAAELTNAQLAELSPAVLGDNSLLEEELTRAVRRAFKTYGTRRPAVLPVILRL